MAFKKASAEQAALKMSIYGPPGSGKTFSTLLIAEGLAKLDKKRIAFVDTENGTVFYSRKVETREAHPEAFDFDAIYTRSITEVVKEIKTLKHSEHSVIVIDSITHLWESCIAAYTGRKGPGGQIPMHAWGAIKRPYKEMMNFLLNSPFHVFILGRQGNEFDEIDGEIKAVGYKMKAEGETPYEPHVCLRMELVRHGAKNMLAIPTAHVEKDRTGILHGKSIPYPSFDTVARPLLGLLGKEQTPVQSDEEAAQHDAEELAAQERARVQESARLREDFSQKLNAAKDADTVEKIGTGITPDIKRRLLPNDYESLKVNFKAARERVKIPVANGQH